MKTRRGGQVRSIRMTIAGGDPRREVLLGIVRTDAPELADQLARAREMLEFTKRAWTGNRRTKAALAEHLTGRALARVLLARRAGCEPRAVRLRVSPLGRPEVAAPHEARGLRFSIAHSDGVVLCAVTRGAAIGADIESIEAAAPDALGTAGLVCTPGEQRHLRSLPANRRAERLATLWTIKEALAKATGLGASLPFETISVALQTDGTAVVSWRRGTREERSLWSLALLRPDPDHVAAIAVCVADGRGEPVPGMA